ncbi:hypothetical protein D9M72_545080 [compost metagenome]
MQALEHRKPERQRVFRLVVEEDQRAEIVVPGVHEVEGSDQHQRRHHQRQMDAPVDVEGVGAIHARGLVDLHRYGHDVLAQQEDEECVGKVGGHDQGLQRVDPAEQVELHIERDHLYVPRDHHGGEQQDEQRVAAREAKAGKTIGNQRRGNELADRRQHHDDQ